MDLEDQLDAALDLAFGNPKQQAEAREKLEDAGLIEGDE